MDENNSLRTAASVAGFLARHLLALGVMVAVPCALWTVAYVTLLVYAMVANEYPVGLREYLAGLVVIFTGMTGFGLCVCFPVTAVVERISIRRGWPMRVQFPVCLGVLLLILATTGVCAAVQPEGSWLAVPMVSVIGFVVLVAPFTIYWGFARSGAPMSVAVIRRLRGIFRKKNLLNDG